MPAVEWRLVTEQVLGRLATRDPATDPEETWQGTGPLAGVTVYDGRVPDVVPTLENSGGRVAPYVVLRTSPGAPLAERAVYDDAFDSLMVYTATAVAGWRADCENLASLVHGLLYHWAPTLDGYSFAPMVPPPGYAPPVTAATGVSPARFWVPLQYRLPVSR